MCKRCWLIWTNGPFNIHELRRESHHRPTVPRRFLARGIRGSSRGRLLPMAPGHTPEKMLQRRVNVCCQPSKLLTTLWHCSANQCKNPAAAKRAKVNGPACSERGHTCYNRSAVVKCDPPRKCRCVCVNNACWLVMFWKIEAGSSRHCNDAGQARRERHGHGQDGLCLVNNA